MHFWWGECGGAGGYIGVVLVICSTVYSLLVYWLSFFMALFACHWQRAVLFPKARVRAYLFVSVVFTLVNEIVMKAQQATTLRVFVWFKSVRPT